MTLEDYFYSFDNKLDVFPSRHDYVTTYKGFKQFMEEYVHPEVKSFMSRLNQTIYLNDHSANHVRMIIDKVSELVKDGEDGLIITPYECFILLTAIQIHDAGHVVGGRDNHASNSKEFLEQFNKYIIAPPERVFIFQIAEAHSGTRDPIGKLQLSTDYSNQKIRPRLLAALLRLGDELADEYSRGSAYLLEKGRIPEKSRLYHAFSCCLYTFKPRIESHDVIMKFSIDKKLSIEEFEDGDKKILLLDEIYLRTMKTFQECLYYNRFVPEMQRLTTVNVIIDFIDESKLVSYYDSISYRLEEKGYPFLMNNDIFSICKDDLTRNGFRLDGSYVKRQIENNKSDDTKSI